MQSNSFQSDSFQSDSFQSDSFQSDSFQSNSRRRKPAVWRLESPQPITVGFRRRLLLNALSFDGYC
jgi:hypothetical protein